LLSLFVFRFCVLCPYLQIFNMMFKCLAVTALAASAMGAAQSGSGSVSGSGTPSGSSPAVMTQAEIDAKAAADATAKAIADATAAALAEIATCTAEKCETEYTACVADTKCATFFGAVLAGVSAQPADAAAATVAGGDAGGVVFTCADTKCINPPTAPNSASTVASAFAGLATAVALIM